jgi:hypothetical protein
LFPELVKAFEVHGQGLGAGDGPYDPDHSHSVQSSRVRNAHPFWSPSALEAAIAVNRPSPDGRRVGNERLPQRRN